MLVTNPRKPADTAGALELEEKLVGQIYENARKLIEEAGYVYIGAGIDASWASRQDAIAFTPRKKHYSKPRNKGDLWFCDVPFVSLKNVTDKAEEVTCKRCVALMKAAGIMEKQGGEG